MCFSVKYLPGLTVYLKAPETFQNLANNCTVNPNGKLITLSPSEKKNKKQHTVQCSQRPPQDATLLHRKGNFPPFIININKRQRQAIEDGIKKKYNWQQADKKVIKGAGTREKDRGASLLFKPLPCFLKHYSEECVYCSANRSISIPFRTRRRNCTLITNFTKALQNTLIHLQEAIFSHFANTVLFTAFTTCNIGNINKYKSSLKSKNYLGTLRGCHTTVRLYFPFNLACHKYFSSTV